ncbi:hypothetical protein MRB53_032030 [Persea americana]|uniref:Uncharacterized protein n=1 Tax=Persea americana TaxID=3435 RepID=A0ACC2KQM0_PERAE|nr:hypothetical protein MRB53_032030 [Persea americana]
MVLGLRKGKEEHKEKYEGGDRNPIERAPAKRRRKLWSQMKQQQKMVPSMHGFGGGLLTPCRKERLFSSLSKALRREAN